MPAEKNGSVLYELNGRSLRAAEALEKEVAAEMTSFDLPRRATIRESREAYARMIFGLTARLKRERPDIVADTGLEFGVISVRHLKDTLPRAYHKYPEIFASDYQPTRYYMFAPVSHDGKYFAPPGAREIDDEAERQKIVNQLFGGGWNDSAPLVQSQDEGVATPLGYNGSPASVTNPYMRATATHRVFIPAGRSLEIVKDIERREKEWRTAVEKARDMVLEAAGETLDEALKLLPAGELVKVNVGYNFGGGSKNTYLTLSMEQEGNTDYNNIGRPVTPPGSLYYTLKNNGSRDLTITPRTDTPEGRKLAALLNKIPPSPGPDDYPELRADFRFKQTTIERNIGIDGVVPFIRKIGGHTLLLYHSDDSVKSDFVPAGAIRVPAAVFDWIEQDQGDDYRGVKRPPMPPEIAAALAQAPKEKGPRKKQGPSPRFGH